MLFNAKDKAGEFLRATLAPTLVYTARVTPDIAYSIDDVDRVMKWGFAWDLGPFETGRQVLDVRLRPRRRRRRAEHAGIRGRSRRGRVEARACFKTAGVR